jgi:hypothetical protein
MATDTDDLHIAVVRNAALSFYSGEVCALTISKLRTNLTASIIYSDGPEVSDVH